MKKRILSIITTCLVIGVITFLSSYYILKPNISNLKELNNTKEFTKEEQNKLINEINDKYSLLNKEINTKYDENVNKINEEYLTDKTKLDNKYSDLSKEITEKYSLKEKEINKKISELEYNQKNEFFKNGLSKKYYSIQDEISALQSEKSTNMKNKSDEEWNLTNKKMAEENTLNKKKNNDLKTQENEKTENLEKSNKDKEYEIEKIKNINSERLINKIKYIALIFLSILIILIPIIYVIIVFNKLIKLRNQVKESWSTIDILLKKRTDLIPNIVEVIKGYSKYEKKTITEIIKARSNVLNATSKEESIKNNEALSKSVDKILLLKEEYPELKADKNYMSLQNKLSDLEDEISNSRIKYNKDVLKYKNEIEKVPSNIIANIFKFKPELFFEIDKEEKENKKISFK